MESFSAQDVPKGWSQGAAARDLCADSQILAEGGEGGGGGGGGGPESSSPWLLHYRRLLHGVISQYFDPCPLGGAIGKVGQLEDTAVPDLQRDGGRHEHAWSPAHRVF
eukprot:SAG22_NODE_606_length_8615_cov_6.190348_11_plen_108_part_00